MLWGIRVYQRMTCPSIEKGQAGHVRPLPLAPDDFQVFSKSNPFSSKVTGVFYCLAVLVRGAKRAFSHYDCYKWDVNQLPVLNTKSRARVKHSESEFSDNNNRNQENPGRENNIAIVQSSALTANESINVKKELRDPTNGSERHKKDREPVKLTMKQGLIMNQIISIYALADVKNSVCKNHTEEFKRGLRALKPWALQMFDASSKVNSGILNGNLAEYGAYTQCLNIYENTKYGPIRGRHCSFRIMPTENLLQIILGFRNISERKFQLLKTSVMDGVKLMWSVCVPDSCQVEDIFPHFNKAITDVTEGLGLTVTLKKEDCISLNDLPKLDKGDYVVIIGLGTVVVVVIITSFIDYSNNGISNWFISSFSAYSNGKHLFSVESNGAELDCLNGLRYISIVYVVTGHRFIHNMIYPTSNSMDTIYWVERYFSTLVMGGTVSVDTFFLIASTLVSYHFFLTVTKIKRFSFFYFYLYRNIRIIMPLVITVTVYATLLDNVASGPTWDDHLESTQKPCQFFWWSTLLNLQSYVNPQVLVLNENLVVVDMGKPVKQATSWWNLPYPSLPFNKGEDVSSPQGSVCIPQVWYLTNDMIFYYFSPLVTIPLWKWKTFGYINFVIIYVASIISSLWIAWSSEFDGGMPITPLLLQTKYFQKHYIVPHARASPYILGLLFGYALFKTRGKRIPINFFVNILGWSITGFVLVSVVVVSHYFHTENYKYNRLFSSLFLSCSRSLWTLGVMWIIFSCVNGSGGKMRVGVVNVILSHWIFKVLGRLAYNVYLWHYIFQGSMQASRKAPQYFSDFLCLPSGFIMDDINSCPQFREIVFDSIGTFFRMSNNSNSPVNGSPNVILLHHPRLLVLGPFLLAYSAPIF
ncbi:hypothetical protein NQ317_009440 [Molorchus minor]|uniref:Nose resistant-to-fluoxetine protein N-terminal domain-containing protein n=1 Tax=Molorchus minor TaxID=1323400 RepID=A0ABQ9J7D0_9CUCU|nr:hypothetical protein NQ317_009440 [Molorchus minor]